MGRDSTTSGNCDIYVKYPHTNSPVMIGGINVLPSNGNSGSLQVLNKWKSTSAEKIVDTLKLDTYVDRKLSDGRDSASIFSKVIGRELSHGSSADLCSLCWMDFASNVVQTKVPQFMDCLLLAINTLDEFGIQGTPATRIRRPMDGSIGLHRIIFLANQPRSE